MLHFRKIFAQLLTKITLCLKKTPRHPSLHFKKVGKVWSARVGIHHRAIATEIEGGFLWVWIGSHADYDKYIA